MGKRKVAELQLRERGSNSWLWPVQTFTAAPASANLE